jgi:membrane associated rhomboid family serine protease
MCVVSFLLQLVAPAWTDALIFSPAIGEVEPWRFLTTTFLHSQGMILHLGFNAYLLWILGTQVEAALGRLRMLALFTVSALGGTVMVTLLSSRTELSWVTGVIGASGAVFGLAGAFLVMLRRLRRDPRQIIVFLVLNAVLGFVVSGISWQGHIGGFAAGAALGAVYAYAPRERRALVGVVGTVAVAAVLVILAVLKYAGA